ncbi:MAG TPA: alpha/beta fold hydrolase [Solirubrobacteraceae bacterium]|nr:alpha/beta fold hydrolase [Solirubrobacteraceae bacterium]
MSVNPSPQARARTVSAAGGATLFWMQEGQGPRVLLVHGGTGTGAHDWEYVREPLRRNHRLLICDLRGHGQSDDPSALLGLRQIGDDTEVLLEAAGGCDAIVAFSIGATAMLALLARRPDLTRAFVSIAGSVRGDPEQVPRIVSGPWPQELIALRHEHATDPEHWRRLRAAMATSWSEHHLSEAELAGIDVPTLVVSGDRDRVEPLRTALSLFETLPRAELFVLPGCGHFVPRERPVALAAAVEAFLRRVLR